jgi:hypothetical protein
MALEQLGAAAGGMAEAFDQHLIEQTNAIRNAAIRPIGSAWPT